MHNPTLGNLINEFQQRDAIHVAIAPVVASVKLYPGQDVGFIGDDRSRVGIVEKPIGIIDPFLKQPVFPEQRCWMLLYQQTITSLRHDWTHPAFEAGAPNQAVSLAWMKEFAECAGLSHHVVIEAGRTYLEHGEVYVQYGSESARSAAYDAGPEFWKHYEVLTGEKVPEDKRDRVPFSCSC